MADDKLLTEQLFETDDAFRYEIIKEDVNGKKKYLIRGSFSKAGVVNKNKRLYPRNVMAESLKECTEMMSQNRMVGELEHPASPKINLERISHKINKLELAEDGTLLGEMEVLDTPTGKILQTLIDSNVGLGVSTRGTGSVKKIKYQVKEGVFEDVLEVQPDFKLRAIDIVFDPSAGEFGTPQFVAEGLELFNEPSNKITFGEVWGRLFS
jgi:hypothetical protein